jgi:hypothetical protein
VRRRAYALEIGRPGAVGTRYDGISYSAQVEQGPRTTCRLTIRNPGEIAERIGDDGAIVRVLAGYEDEVGAVELAAGTIVRGTVEDARTTAEPSISMDLLAGQYTAERRIIALTLPPGVDTLGVIVPVRDALGLLPDSIALATPQVYQRGYIVAGRGLGVLRSLVLDAGSEYAITGQRLRIWPRGQSAPVRAERWSPESGLLEASLPAGESGIVATCLLRPAVRPGDVVVIASPRYTGEVVAREVRHDLDTEGQAWITTIRARPRGA